MKKITVLQADGVRVELDGVPELEDLQRLVGGFIEVRNGRNERGQLVQLVINEDGKRLDLPVNAAATELFHRVYSFDVLRGDAVVFDGVRLP